MKHHTFPRTHLRAEKVMKLGNIVKMVYKMSAAARFFTKSKEILSSLMELYLTEEYRTVPLPSSPNIVMKKQKMPRGIT